MFAWRKKEIILFHREENIKDRMDDGCRMIHPIHAGKACLPSLVFANRAP